MQAYPLSWPVAYPRTSSVDRQRAKFEVSFGVARHQLLDELRLLNVSELVISSNIPLRKDGLPYANYSPPEDPGVVVYFNLEGSPYALACDRWDKAKDNLRAIGLHVAAMRGMLRWGVGSTKQAFMGYQLLPPSKDSWWIVLGVSPTATADEVQIAYRTLARKCHPDFGGTHDEMAKINSAYEQTKIFFDAG